MITPSRASRDTLSTIQGQSLYTTTGLYLISGSVRDLCIIVSTGNSFVTYYLPSTPPGNLRSGNLQIFNAYGSATSTDYQIYLDPVYISGINPSSGFTGTTYFRISGSGIRDLTGLWFNDLYTGVLTDPIFENSTWLRSGQVPFFSGGLNSYFSVKGMSEGGSSVSPTLFFVREDGQTLSGFTDFPIPFVPLNYLRENASATSLEWRTPTEVRSDINAISKLGDFATGDYTISGDIKVTGLTLHSTGLSTGQTIMRTTIFSGNTLICDAIVGGISWRMFSYKYS